MLKVQSSESLRLHLDWWQKCRTCEFWSGDRKTCEDGLCEQPRGDFGGEITTSEGHCGNWESYDLETAMEIIQAEKEAEEGDPERLKALQSQAYGVPHLTCRFCRARNVHTNDRCQGCGKRYWNDPDNTRMGRTLGESARQDPDIARAQDNYEKGMHKLLGRLRKEQDG